MVDGGDVPQDLLDRSETRGSPAQGRQKSCRWARIRPTLLERSPTPSPPCLRSHRRTFTDSKFDRAIRRWVGSGARKSGWACCADGAIYRNLGIDCRGGRVRGDDPTDSYLVPASSAASPQHDESSVKNSHRRPLGSAGTLLFARSPGMAPNQSWKRRSLVSTLLGALLVGAVVPAAAVAAPPRRFLDMFAPRPEPTPQFIAVPTPPAARASTPASRPAKDAADDAVAVPSWQDTAAFG